MRIYRATPTEVIDGGTYKATSPDWQGERTVRMAGIDAPELDKMDEDEFPAAYMLNWNLLCSHGEISSDGSVELISGPGTVEGCPKPSELLLVVPPRAEGPYGRTLAWTMIVEGSEVISADAMIGSGRSTEWYYRLDLVDVKETGTVSP